VSERRTVRDFAGRYRRWSVLQRQAVGPVAYAAQALLNPVLLAALPPAADPALAALAAVCAAKAALDGAVARALRPGGFRLAQLVCVPVKDLVLGAAWVHGLARRDMVWRGKRIRVTRGTRIEGASAPALPAGDGATALS
jgi:ceramide glucosyltransferase